MVCVAHVIGAVAVAAALVSPSVARATSPLLDPPDRIAVSSEAMDDVSVLDFNGDGWPDLAMAGRSIVQLIIGGRDGWDPAQVIAIPVTVPVGRAGLAVGDLTGDERDDLVIALPGPGEVALLRGRQDGVLTGPSPSDVYDVADPDAVVNHPPGSSIDVGDVDSNGSFDVVAAFRTAYNVGSKIV